MAESPSVTPTAPPGEAERFPLELPGFTGTLEQLVARAQRGDVDLDGISVAAITGAYRARIDAAGDRADLREMADFLALAARLVALKAGTLDPSEATVEEEDAPADEAGRRLAEYRLFKAAAEALLAEAAEEGARSFLGMVVPEQIPVERLRIPAERLAAAFRDVLERLSEAEPLPVGAVTYSVEEKMGELRARLRGGILPFDELFASVSTRLEAVACFLALLELLRLGEAVVEQPEAFGPIRVRAHG